MLKQSIRIIALLLAFLSSACAGAASTPQPITPTSRSPDDIRSAPTREPGCTVVTRKPTPGPTRPAQAPAPGAKDWSRGASDAAITIIDYSDFQCPGCAYVEPVLARLVENFPHDVRVIYRHYPLISVYDKSALAAQAAEAAGLQGQFWQMHDLLFARREEWAPMSVDQFQEWLGLRAKDLRLDVERFSQDLTSKKLVDAIQAAYYQNLAVQMPGTPYLLINGEPYEGPLGYGDLEAVVTLTLLEKRQFTDCPPMTIDPTRQYLAILHTEKGDIVLELFADIAPLAVNNFVFLARQGWYDGVTFHRVIPGFVAQAGDPSGTGLGGPGYAFDNEISELKFDRPGVVGMANAGPGSNGSQFFITFAAAPHLNGGYTIFGQVISGMDVLAQLTPRDPSKPGDWPPGDRILSVEIQEK